MEPLNVIEGSAALMATIDAAGRVLLFNTRCEEVCGIARESALGRPWVELFVRPEERVPVAEQLVLARSSRAETRFTAALPQDDASRRRSVRWHLTELSPEILCATGIDVTGEEESAARFRRNERMAALGTMTAGLAHELRNPLNAAHLQLSVARRRLARSTGDAGAARAVELAGAEMARLAVLVEDFLQFARPQTLRLERVDLRSLAQETVALLTPEAVALGAELEISDGPPVFTELDREKLKQVLLNLVRNGLDAAGSGGRVRIEVQQQGGSVLLTVEDSGLGFPEDAPIFEPFFTTKSGGTGLGLAIVHRIVADHGGTVRASSRSGNMTVFSVLLPNGHAERELA